MGEKVPKKMNLKEIGIEKIIFNSDCRNCFAAGKFF